MAIYPTKLLEIPGMPNQWSFIPVAPTSSERGGIIADTTVDPGFELEVKVKENGKAYVEHDEAKFDKKLDAADSGKFIKVDTEGNVVPVAMAFGIETSYIEETRTLRLLNPGAGEVSIDSSLVTPGKAADAKATGEEITELKARVAELENFISSLIDAGKQLY